MFTHVLRHFEDCVDAHVNLGIAKKEQGMVDEAMEEGQTTEKCKPCGGTGRVAVTFGKLTTDQVCPGCMGDGFRVDHDAAFAHFSKLFNRVVEP